MLALQPPATPEQRRTAWTVVAHTAFERAQFDQSERAYGEVLALLRQLQQTMGLGMLFVTHDLAVASGFCHRLVVLDGGRIVEQGEGAALLVNPRAEITRRLVQACPRLPALG